MKKAKEEENVKMTKNNKNIFVKIRAMFISLLKKNRKPDNIKNNQKIENIKMQNENIFKEKLKVDMRIENLQRKLKTGQITLNDIERTDKKKIIKLYQNQIIQKRNKLKQLMKAINS